MPVANFATSRRGFVQLAAGTAAITAAGAVTGAALGAVGCTNAPPTVATTGAIGAGALQYFIDGIFYGTRSDLPPSANLAVFMPLTQSPSSYVERVLLLGPGDTVMGLRTFEPADKMHKNDFCPYVIFEGLALAASATYKVLCLVKSGDQLSAYQASIAGPALSNAGSMSCWPNAMRTDLAALKPFTTPMQHYTRNGVAVHTARGRFLSIGGDGSFSLQMDFMQADAAAAHYMRYFAVLDPVGRLVGLRKRTGTSDNTGVSGSAITFGAVDAGTISTFAIDPNQVASILDCPYVQLIADDVYEVLSRVVIRLR